MQCEKCGCVQSETARSFFDKIKTAERQREIAADRIICDLTIANLTPSSRRETDVRAMSARAQNCSAPRIPAEKEKIIKNRRSGDQPAIRCPGDFAAGIEAEQNTNVAFDFEVVVTWSVLGPAH